MSDNIKDNAVSEERNSEYQNLLKSFIKINEELTRNKLQLEECSSSMEKALYKMTHDLFSPLSNIEGLVNILKINGYYQDENNKAIIDMISDAVGKFKVRIKEATNLPSMIKNNERKDCRNLNEVFELIKEKFNNSIDSTEAVIQVNFESSSNSLCYESNYCILHNLLSHSLNGKLDKSQPKILIKSYLDSGYNVIEMEEEGRDLLKDIKAFTIDESLDHTNTIDGLYLVRKIAESAGGGLTLNSKGKKLSYKVYFK